MLLYYRLPGECMERNRRAKKERKTKEDQGKDGHTLKVDF